MPDKRLAHTRAAALPEGYQYGDAGRPAIRIRFLREFTIKANVEPTMKRLSPAILVHIK